MRAFVLPLIHKALQYNITRRDIYQLIGMMVFAYVYYFVSEHSVIFNSTTGNVASIWPVAGIGFAVLYLWGYHFAIGIWLAEMKLFLLDSYTPDYFFIATFNTIALLTGVWLVKRFLSSPYLLGRFKHVITFLVGGALVSSFISATGGVVTLLVFDFVSSDEMLMVWWTWLLADIVGVLVIAPLIITWHPAHNLRFFIPKPWETFILFVIACATAWLMFGLTLAEQVRAYPLTFALMPFSIWSAFRCGQRESVSLIFVISIVAVGGTVDGLGPFIRPSLYESLLLLQVFIAVLCITTLFLTATVNERQELEKSMARFIPTEFIRFLEKESIVDVQLGDQVQKQMTVLFSDIRSFTEVSEQMTPQENFNFINAYLTRMEPIIGQYDGFIDKFIGDAIMALFPRNSDTALKSAIDMLATLKEYNLTRGRPGRPILRIGIGLHTGDLTLGIVGGVDRVEGTVISDAVNLASRTESLTKIYGVELLITENTFRGLKEQGNYHIRLIDHVVVKGKSKAVTVYEVFDNNSDDIKQQKLNTLREFEQGIKSYKQAKYTEAYHVFNEILQKSPHDSVAKVYLKRCMNDLTT